MYWNKQKIQSGIGFWHVCHWHYRPTDIHERTENNRREVLMLPSSVVVARRTALGSLMPMIFSANNLM